MSVWNNLTTSAGDVKVLKFLRKGKSIKPIQDLQEVFHLELTMLHSVKTNLVEEHDLRSLCCLSAVHVEIHFHITFLDLFRWFQIEIRKN